MRRAAILALTLIGLPLTATANDFEPIRDRGQFLTLVEGRELRLGSLGVTLRVAGDGTIQGQATLRPVTGQWAWRDGYFCREGTWGNRAVPYNCQLVEASANGRVRFTVDRGAGQSAEFTIR